MCEADLRDSSLFLWERDLIGMFNQGGFPEALEELAMCHTRVLGSLVEFALNWIGSIQKQRADYEDIQFERHT